MIARSRTKLWMIPQRATVPEIWREEQKGPVIPKPKMLKRTAKTAYGNGEEDSKSREESSGNEDRIGGKSGGTAYEAYSLFCPGQT